MQVKLELENFNSRMGSYKNNILINRLENSGMQILMWIKKKFDFATTEINMGQEFDEKKTGILKSMCSNKILI